MRKLIAYDLGTGGVKAAIYNEQLQVLAQSFIEYETYYPGPNRHEQRPSDWWSGVIQSTGRLLADSGIAASEVACISLSGHSLVAIPLDQTGQILLEQVPIWSDTRAEAETKTFFETVDPSDWYMATGNGFPAACYPVFKLMWLKQNQPDVFARTVKLLGSKDYINYRLTGQVFTDPSYASGSGTYSLTTGQMIPEFLAAAGLSSDLYPPIVPSHQIIGQVTAEAAAETGLVQGTAVVCGGVDNACMALGSVGVGEGSSYLSLGSSSWIAVNSHQPLLDKVKRPYVFAHIESGMFTSAFSIFAGGNSFRWIRNTLAKDLPEHSDTYRLIDETAAQSPVGSNGVLFNPSLAGGTSLDKSPHIRGAFLGLELGTAYADLLRASLEGIALNLRICLDTLRSYAPVASQLLICGGGSKSTFWMKIFADVFNMDILTTNINQDAASLGAAAIAARGIGLKSDYTFVPGLHQIKHRFQPDPDHVTAYSRLLELFTYAAGKLAEIGDMAKKTPIRPEEARQ